VRVRLPPLTGGHRILSNHIHQVARWWGEEMGGEAQWAYEAGVTTSSRDLVCDLSMAQ
jgi:hypothetical protein